MYSEYTDTNGGACRRDYEKEIEALRRNLKVKVGMKVAMENLKMECGFPGGAEGIGVYALYGDMCLEVKRLSNNIDEVIAAQTAYEARKAEK